MTATSFSRRGAVMTTAARRSLAIRASRIAVMGAVMLLTACGLPRSGPTRGEIFKGSVLSLIHI